MHTSVNKFVTKLSIIILLVLAPLCRSQSRYGDCIECLNRSVDHDGNKRTYLLYEPKNRPAGKLPLLIVIHGGGGNASSIFKLTKGRFHELADRDGFLVVYPEGVDRHWNDLRSDAVDRSHKENVDDVGFISEVIGIMVREKGADPARVYATGISNGGFMSYRLACSLPGKIRAIASVTASLPANSKEVCSPARPIPVLIMNGTKDPLVPYNGGHVTIFGVSRGAVLSTEETVSFWVKQNRCGEKYASAALPDINPGDGSTVAKTVYPSSSGTPCVVLYAVEGGGHTWPGGWQYLGKAVVGSTNRDINACDEIWDFFRQIR